MKFYVSGPVVEYINEQELIGRAYWIIEQILKKSGHSVALPLRSRDIDTLAPRDFFNAVQGMIGESNGVITVLVDKDQSGPVEATVASTKGVPQCVIDLGGGIVRLIIGLPYVSDVSVNQISSIDDVSKVIPPLIEQFLKKLGGQGKVR